jgi:hypothetical protein
MCQKETIKNFKGMAGESQKAAVQRETPPRKAASRPNVGWSTCLCVLTIIQSVLTT